jgi:hypothetical protein
MAIKPSYDTINDVPEVLRDSYVERDGRYHLVVEGLVPKARVDEFRESSIAARKALDEFKAQFEGVDPDKFRELAEKEAKQRDKRLIDAGKVDELVAEKTGAMKSDYEQRMSALVAKESAATKALEALLVDSALRDAAAKAGVLPTATDDVLLRGRQTFRLHEGRAVAFEGDRPIYGKDSEPLSIAEWTAGLAEKAPHLFASTAGGGASGGEGRGGNFGVISRTDRNSFLRDLDKIAANQVSVT